MAELRFNLAGAGGSLRSHYAPFMAYAEQHLLPLRIAAGEVAPVIDAVLEWHESPPPQDRHTAEPELAGLERLDRDLYVGPGRVCWFRIDDFRDLHLRFDWDGRQLHVHGHYYFYLSRDRLRDRTKRWWAGARLRAQRLNRFTTLLYYLAYYPAFWWCETQMGFHPIHAAGAVTDAGAVVLAGPSGVGKSTLALALAAQPAQLLSETFLLHRGATLRPVREPLLLDEWSRSWLGSAMSGLEPLRAGFVFSRNGYHRLAGLAEEGRAAAVLLPRRAPRTYVRAISAEEAHQRLSAANQIVKDMRRYWAFAAALDPLAPSGLMAQREAELARLTAGARCGEFGLGPELKLGDAVRQVREFLSAESLPVTRRARCA
ncbi:MAG: hypothetical protein HY699_01230 [Deltaproteobacteria bacterium]|nr:hypothetical protein [Deltaproteobacteria bacterium]